jgi:hypothetical protein
MVGPKKTMNTKLLNKHVRWRAALAFSMGYVTCWFIDLKLDDTFLKVIPLFLVLLLAMVAAFWIGTNSNKKLPQDFPGRL